MTSTYETLLTTLDDGILTITLNRPDKMNAWTFQLGAELRVEEAGLASQLFGSPADFWGTYTYRRPTPNDILVPSLIHLGLE